MESPNRTLNFEFEGHSYSLTFPNNQQFLQIHNLKSSLLPNYDNLAFMGIESEYSRLLADAIAHLSILCKDLTKDLNMVMTELPFEQGIKIVDLYTKTFRPWYDEWMNFLFKPSEQVTES